MTTGKAIRNKLVLVAFIIETIALFILPLYDIQAFLGPPHTYPISLSIIQSVFWIILLVTILFVVTTFYLTLVVFKNNKIKILIYVIFLMTILFSVIFLFNYKSVFF